MRKFEFHEREIKKVYKTMHVTQFSCEPTMYERLPG